jgi:hypothetical protein
MKKLLFMAVVGIGGFMFLKGNVSVTPDNQVRVAGWAVPVPPDVQNSPLMAVVAMAIRLHTTPPPDARYGAAQPGQPALPPLPTVTSATATYGANVPSTGPVPGADLFGSTAKALRGQ